MKNRISSESLKICNDYKTLKKAGNMPLNDEQFIRWACELYGVDYSTAKNGVSFALNDLTKDQQDEMSQVVDEEKIVNNIVENLENKLSPEEQEVKEMFTDVKEI